MSDMTQNMSAYQDPKVFVPWANAVTEPGFYTTMGTLMMDPAGWTRMMGTAMDPRAYANMAEFAEGLDTVATGKWAAVFDTRLDLDTIEPAPLRWVVEAGGYAASRLAKRMEKFGRLK